MAASHSIARSAPINGSAPGAFGAAFLRAARSMTEGFLANRTYSELSKLTPAQLRDIGLDGRDLGEVSRELSRLSR